MTTIKLLTFNEGAQTATYQINGTDPARDAIVDGKKVIINDYGTFDLTNGVGSAEFVADAGLTGELAIRFGTDTSLTGAKLLKADFSKTSGVKFTDSSFNRCYLPSIIR